MIPGLIEGLESSDLEEVVRHLAEQHQCVFRQCSTGMEQSVCPPDRRIVGGEDLPPLACAIQRAALPSERDTRAFQGEKF